jgi:hypothetical protein
MPDDKRQTYGEDSKSNAEISLIHEFPVFAFSVKSFLEVVL